MNHLARCILISMTMLSLGACSNSSSVSNSAYQELSWDDLKPEDEKEIDQVEYFGSLEISGDWDVDEQEQNESGFYSEPLPPAFSDSVVSKFNGKSIRLAGFVVPLAFDSENLVSEFFLVPYFGACYHLPPPPPNQIIYVSSAEPFEYENIDDPVWVMGVIDTQQTGNEVATASYSMYLDQLEPYEE